MTALPLVDHLDVEGVLGHVELARDHLPGSARDVVARLDERGHARQFQDFDFDLGPDGAQPPPRVVSRPLPAGDQTLASLDGHAEALFVGHVVEGSAPGMPPALAFVYDEGAR